MPSDLVFALPAGSEQVSGGNIYNDQLIRALRALPPPVAVHQVGVEACRARIARGEPGHYFVDSLNLRELVDFPVHHPGQWITLIVHHLPSLEPDADPLGAAVQIEEAALARADAFLATSPFTAALLAGRGYAAERILIVPPATDAVAAETGARRAYETPLRALIVGNLIPRKGIAELFAALAPRLAPGDQFSLEVVGRADLDPAYARRCRDLAAGCPRLASIVRFRGAIPHAQMPTLYESANVLVSAARMETFGMALQEGRSHGLPILAIDGGYVRHHFTHGDDGLLFGSFESLAEGLLALVRDPRRAQPLFDHAQNHRPASDYDWPRAARDLWRQITARLE